MYPARSPFLATLSVATLLTQACPADPTTSTDGGSSDLDDGGTVDEEHRPHTKHGDVDNDGGTLKLHAHGGGLAPEEFSFFVTSLRAMQRLSANQHGFGGDLRYGETGAGAGLRGADKICTQIAELSMPGSAQKRWRAFLSATIGADHEPVDAIDRIGDGPWYDRVGRLVAEDIADLLHDRPRGADPVIIDDLPNEEGVPNRNPDALGWVDNHNVLTGSNERGRLYSDAATCLDWTSRSRDVDGPRIGHSWPGATNQTSWVSAENGAGCGARVSSGLPDEQTARTVAVGGGYGAIYCFALEP